MKPLFSLVAGFWNYQPWWARVPLLPLTVFFAVLGSLDGALRDANFNNEKGDTMK